jgi:hypothetical protein
MNLKKLILKTINEKLAAPVKEPGVKPPPTKPSPRPRPQEPSIIPRPGPATRPKAKSNRSIEAFKKNRSKKHEEI